MKRKAHIILLVLLLLCVLSTTAFAIDESEVESAIAASSKEEVAGNAFIWFLCAIGFLKVSQKIDSFMASLGINVGRTGGSMLNELMVAGRGIAAVAGAVGGTVFNHLEMSRNVQSGNTQNLKSMVIQRSFPKWSVAERRKTAAASNQAAVCACAHSRYFAGGSPSGLRV